MRKVSQTGQFSRDVKRLRKRGKDLTRLEAVIRFLAEGTPLPAYYNDHPLVGHWQPSRDCHIEPDWILIYTSDKDSLVLERTGSHSDLFR